MQKKDIQKDAFYIFRYKHAPEDGFVVQAHGDNWDTFRDHLKIENNVAVHYNSNSGSLTMGDQFQVCDDQSYIQTLKLSRAKGSLVISHETDNYEIY